MSAQDIRIRDAAHDRMLAVAPHQEQIRRRQHRDRDAAVGHLPRQRR